MKNYLNIYKFSRPILLLIFAVTFFSCERPWVQPWPPDGARLPTDVWANYNLSRGFIEKVYADQVGSAGIMDVEGNGMMASACDEA